MGEKTPNRHTMGDLKQMQSLPLKIKVQMTERRIFDWYDYWQGDVYLSFSGGKDSTVLKHIIDNMGLGIPSVFVNTGLEYPEIQKFAMSQPNVTTIRPKMMFNEVITKYGYPIISKAVAMNVHRARTGGEGSWYHDKLFGKYEYNGKKSIYCNEKYSYLYDAPFRISERCCDVMKKRPAHAYGKETGRVPILATMADESRNRTARWLADGCNAFNANNPHSAPMSFWTEQDVLHYIKENNIPYCSQIYGDICVKHSGYGDKDQVTFSDYLDRYDECELCTTKADRTGCMFCAFGCHREREPNRFQRMKETHPRQYEYCIGGGEFVDGMWQPNKQGLGLGYVLDYIGVNYK